MCSLTTPSRLNLYQSLGYEMTSMRMHKRLS